MNARLHERSQIYPEGQAQGYASHPVEPEKVGVRQRVVDMLAIASPIVAGLTVIFVIVKSSAEGQGRVVCDTLRAQVVAAAAGTSVVLPVVALSMAIVALVLRTTRRWYAAIAILLSIPLILFTSATMFYGCY
jgi:hypothetical protein